MSKAKLLESSLLSEARKLVELTSSSTDLDFQAKLFPALALELGVSESQLAIAEKVTRDGDLIFNLPAFIITNLQDDSKYLAFQNMDDARDYALDLYNYRESDGGSPASLEEFEEMADKDFNPVNGLYGNIIATDDVELNVGTEQYLVYKIS